MSQQSTASSLQQLIDDNLPLLRSFHSKLALTPDLLDRDVRRIVDACTTEFEVLLTEKRRMLDDMRNKVERARRECVALGRALGIPIEVSSILSGEEILPQQLARLETYRDKTLLPAYEARLVEIRVQSKRLSTLTNLLPSEFALRALQPTIPSRPPSIHSRSVPRATRQASPRPLDGETALIDLSLTMNEADKTNLEKEEEPRSCWEDVSEARLNELQLLVSTGETERFRLLRVLRQAFYDLYELLTILEVSLPLPYPLPSAPTTSSSLPTISPRSPLSSVIPPGPSEPTAEVQRYLEIAENFMRWANEMNEGMDELGEMLENDDDSKGWEGMEGVEPEKGMLAWVEQSIIQVQAGKEWNEFEIQRLYDQLETLWVKLNISRDFIDTFIEENRGSSARCLEGYALELERNLRLKAEQMEGLVIETRAQILAVQDELMMTEENKQSYEWFWDTNYTDELLSVHEEELAKLKDELDSVAPLMETYKQWQRYCDLEKKLSDAEADTKRYTRKGFSSLEEEKLRKYVKSHANIEQNLLELAAEWEETNGRAFTLQGERIISIIQEKAEAKELEKEMKKRARQGGNVVSTRSQTPAAQHRPPPPSASRRVMATPSTSHYPGSSMSTVKRKHPPPPTPSSTHPNGKLARTTPRVAGNISRPAGLTACSLPRPGGFTRPTPLSSVAGTRRLVSGSSATSSSSWGTMVDSCSSNRLNSHSLSLSSSASSTSSTMCSKGYSRLPCPTPSKIGMAPSYGSSIKLKQNPRRQSFKPRPSVGGSGLTGEFL
ncbi:Microtubule-associated protein essential for anaphase spindle elongation [Phaffia rhodozyma]|uniref:Microtubule-associated protein essential for anaphase spindle elongation n=1 Tax=Phaffia rhodozyma TaxID=264483 RepID=A0A0F7SFG8_PHARH|nr:Microtubule-associated protein essential for anaphase spindle elongation [Phaffia rhodozyma]